MRNNNKQWHRHYGVYGVCVNKRKELLVIEKMADHILDCGIFLVDPLKILKAYQNAYKLKADRPWPGDLGPGAVCFFFGQRSSSEKQSWLF